ncbi:SLC13 family permease [Staphylococcus arlettae]
MDESIITLLFLIFAIVMFTLEIIPLSISAMIVAIGLSLTGVLTAKEAFAGFVDPNVLLFMAMFIVGCAFFETGMAQKIGEGITHFAKTPKKLLIVVMGITGLMSGFLSNTGTAAVIIPVVIGIAAKSSISRTSLLIPVALAAAMGGNLTLIGAPGNMIAQSTLNLTNQSFVFFEYALIGLPILVVGTLYFGLIGHKLLPQNNDKSETTNSVFDKQVDVNAVPRWKKLMALLVLIFTVLAMIFEDIIHVPLYISAWIGALILVATRVITEKTAMKSIDMNTILLFVGSLSLANAIQKSGAGELIAKTIINILGTSPSPYVLLLVILVISAVMTNFISNTASTALLAPISLSIANSIGADPRAIMMATVMGASMAFATPIGMPANTMVYGLSNITFMQYVKVGLPLIVISIIVCMILLPLLFPFYP